MSVPIKVVWPKPGDSVRSADGNVYHIGEKIGEGNFSIAYIPALAFPSIFYCIGNLFLVFVVADDIVALFRDALRNCGVSVGQ